MFEMKKVSVAVIAALMGMGISGVASASDEDRGKAVTAGDQSGTFKLPGSNTSLGFYGSIRFFAIHDFKQSSQYDYFNDTAAIAIREDNNPNIGSTDTRPGRTYMTARNSRLGFVSATPTDWGKLSTKIELDFASTVTGGSGGASTGGSSPNGRGTVYSGRSNASVRIAQGKIDAKWGSVTMGQKWSAFGNLDAFPDEVDVNFVGSGIGIRQPGVQLDLPFAKAGVLTLAVEDSRSLVHSDGNYIPFLASNGNIQSRPDLIAKWTSSGKWGSAAVSVLNTQYKYENSTSSIQRKENVNGFNFGTNVNLGASDSVQFQFTKGKGISRYMLNTNYHFALLDTTNPTDPQIKPYKSTSYLVGWGHTWSKTIRTSLAYGQTTIDNYFPTIIARDNHKLKEAYVDLWWTPIPKTEFGLEYSWGERKLRADPTTGDVYKGERSRVEFLAKYSF